MPCKKPQVDKGNIIYYLLCAGEPYFFRGREESRLVAMRKPKPLPCAPSSEGVDLGNGMVSSLFINYPSVHNA